MAAVHIQYFASFYMLGDVQVVTMLNYPKQMLIVVSWQLVPHTRVSDVSFVNDSFNMNESLIASNESSQ